MPPSFADACAPVLAVFVDAVSQTEAFWEAKHSLAIFRGKISPRAALLLGRELLKAPVVRALHSSNDEQVAGMMSLSSGGLAMCCSGRDSGQANGIWLSASTPKLTTQTIATAMANQSRSTRPASCIFS
jgi:hypothetical protein